MAMVRKRHDAEFKKKVVLGAIRQQKTVNQITAEYGVHATQVNLWKKHLDAGRGVFRRLNSVKKNFERARFYLNFGCFWS